MPRLRKYGTIILAYPIFLDDDLEKDSTFEIGADFVLNGNGIYGDNNLKGVRPGLSAAIAIAKAANKVLRVMEATVTLSKPIESGKRVKLLEDVVFFNLSSGLSYVSAQEDAEKMIVEEAKKHYSEQIIDKSGREWVADNAILARALFAGYPDLEVIVVESKVPSLDKVLNVAVLRDTSNVTLSIKHRPDVKVEIT